jgi:hypothetical protein
MYQRGIMITLFKKTIVFALVISMMVSFFAIRNTIVVNADDDTLVIEDEDSGYSGIIETIYLDDGIYKYEISEYGESYELLIDTINDKFYVNDIELTIDEYYSLVEEQLGQINNNATEENSMLTLADKYPENPEAISEYEEIHKNYDKEIKESNT